MTIYGYARVSTTDQNTAVQLAAFERAGITNIVEEKRSAVKDRPELERLLDALQPIPLHTSPRRAELPGVAGTLDKDSYLLQAQP